MESSHARVGSWPRAAAVAAVLLAACPAHSQQASYVRLREPSPSDCREARRAAPRPQPSLCLAGVAFDPAGVVQVLINGVAAMLAPADSAGAHSFLGFAAGGSGHVEVELTLRDRGGGMLVYRYAVLVLRPGDRPGDYVLINLSPRVLGGGASGVQILEPREWVGRGTRGITVPSRSSVRVVGLAFHESGVASVEVDGRRASLSPDASGAQRFTAYAAPHRGRDSVEVVVRGHRGAPVVARFPIHSQSSVDTVASRALAWANRIPGRRWAVVIGVGSYRDPAIPGLRFADDDARAVYDFLRSPRAGLGGFAEQNVKLLLNDQATYSGLRSALFSFLRQAAPNDEVLIYFAGKGAADFEQNPYLLTHDSELANLPATALSLQEVDRAVRELNARDILVFTDASHDGGPQVRGPSVVDRINRFFLGELSVGSGGLAVLTASETDQSSLEDERWGGGHGVFTHVLLDGLRGAADENGDSIVTLGEVMGYTRRRVGVETRNVQIPGVSQTSYDPYLPIGMVLNDAELGVVPIPRTGADSASEVAQLDRMREAVRIFPLNAVYRRNFGAALRRAGRPQEALAELREAVRLDARNSDNHYELGLTLRAAGALGDAVAAFQIAMSLDGGSSTYLDAFVSALLDDGQVERALTCIRLAIGIAPARLSRMGRHPDAEDCENTRVPLALAVLPLATATAERLIDAELNAEAEQFLGDLLTAAPGSRRASAQWHFLRGVARQGMGASGHSAESWDAALDDYRVAMLDSALAGSALNNSAKIAEARGRLAVAVDLYRRAAARPNPHPVFAINLARLFERLQEPDSALARYQESLALDTRNHAAHQAVLELALRARPETLPALALRSASAGFTSEALDALKRLLSGEGGAGVTSSAAEGALAALVEVLAGMNPDAADLLEREGPALHRIAERRPELAQAVGELIAPLEAFGTRAFDPGASGWWHQRLERFQPYSRLLARLGDQALAAGEGEKGRQYYLSAVGPDEFRDRWLNLDALIPALALTAESDPEQYATLSRGLEDANFAGTRLEDVRRLYAVLVGIAHPRGERQLAERYARRLSEVTLNLAHEYRGHDNEYGARLVIRETADLYAEFGMMANVAGLNTSWLHSSNLGYIVITQPEEWTGRGMRGITSTRQPVWVRGIASHPSGIARVTVNGAAASTRQDATGATVFTAVLPASAAVRDVQIVAYPVTGEPIVRLQKPDGTSHTWRYTALPQAALPAQCGRTGEARLRVSTGALARAERDALADALHGEPRIELGAGAGAHLSIRREGAEYVVAGPDGAVRHHVSAVQNNAAAPLLPLLIQEYGALQLAELLAPANAFPLDFAFPDGSDFRLGQGIEFRVRSASDGYLTVVDVGTNGVIGVLYPTPADEPKVRGGEELRLPSEAARALYVPETPYQAAAPVGTGVVRAFVTPRPLVFSKTAAGAVSADALLRALCEATGTQPWATAALRYRITDP